MKKTISIITLLCLRPGSIMASTIKCKRDKIGSDHNEYLINNVHTSNVKSMTKLLIQNKFYLISE